MNDAPALFDADLRPATGVAVSHHRDPFAARRAAVAATSATPATVPSGPVLLAVDGNSLAHRGYHAYAGRRARDGHGGDLVGAGLYGFLALLAAVADVVRPAATVIGFDCRQASVRRERHPGYKAQRADKPAALDELLDVAPAVLRDLGGYVVSATGWEADDVCGSAAATAEAERWRCVVATSDRDAYGLISDRTTVLRLRSGMHRAVEVDAPRLRREHGIAPDQYVEFAALRGDTSDNLPGIPGIGPRRARDLLRRYDRVADAVADPLGCRSVLGPDVGQALLDDHAAADSVFRRNVALMRIRRDVPVDVTAGRPRAAPDVIGEVLRERRLPGLIARMTMTFGRPPAVEAPPVGDEHAPPP